MAYTRKTKKKETPKTDDSCEFIATQNFKWFVIDKYITAKEGEVLTLESKYSDQLKPYLEKK